MQRLRPLAYSKAHVILIGYAVDTPDSLENVTNKVSITPTSIHSYANIYIYFFKWVDEATERCPGVPIILVGLKKDLREDPEAREEMRKKSLPFVQQQHAEAVSKQIGARKYLECSALTGEGVDDVFEAATRAALLTFEKDSSTGCCTIL